MSQIPQSWLAYEREREREKKKGRKQICKDWRDQITKKSLWVISPIYEVVELNISMLFLNGKSPRKLTKTDKKK